MPLDALDQLLGGHRFRIIASHLGSSDPGVVRRCLHILTVACTRFPQAGAREVLGQQEAIKALVGLLRSDLPDVQASAMETVQALCRCTLWVVVGWGGRSKVSNTRAAVSACWGASPSMPPWMPRCQRHAFFREPRDCLLLNTVVRPPPCAGAEARCAAGRRRRRDPDMDPRTTLGSRSFRSKRL